MPRTNAPALDPQRRKTLESELREYLLVAKRAEEDLRIHVSRAIGAGMTTREIGLVLEVSYTTIARWGKEGEQARARRRGEGPDRPGERDQDGGRGRGPGD